MRCKEDEDDAKGKKLKIYVMLLLVTKCVILLSFFSDQFSKLEKIQVVR